MTEKSELNSELRQMAIDKGLCAQWQGEWKEDWDLNTMIDRFFSGIDFFLSNRFVSNQFIKENFDKDFLRDRGVLVNDSYSLLNPDHAILLGNSTSTVRLNGYTAATLYIMDEGSAKIKARQNSFVLVHVFGSSQVEAWMEDKARVVILNHSRDAVIIAGNDVRVREEFDYPKKKE